MIRFLAWFGKDLKLDGLTELVAKITLKYSRKSLSNPFLEETPWGAKSDRTIVKRNGRKGSNEAGHNWLLNLARNSTEYPLPCGF